MEQSILLQLGVGVTAAILILREVFGFLKPLFAKKVQADQQNHDTASHAVVGKDRDDARDRMTKLEASDKSQWKKLDKLDKTQDQHTIILTRIDERTKKQNGGH